MTEALIIFISILGSVSTYYFYNSHHQSPIRMSAFLSLVVAYVFFWFPDFLPDDLSESIPYVFMGSTFVGMTSASIMNINWIALSGFLFGILILLLQEAFVGFGGKLGAIAFAAIIFSLVMIRITSFIGHRLEPKEEEVK
jgi:hypothetical protein